MPDGKRVFLTGGTGFLGSHLAAALLKAGHHVTALTRAGTSQTAHQRMTEALGRISDLDSIRVPEHLDVIEGDVTKPMVGLREPDFTALIRSVDEVWHSAASLSFLEDDRDDILRMNVGGTQEIVSLVSRTPTRRIHHISTAYVAGDRTGVALEQELDVGQRFRNPYEESKCEAEMLVASAHDRGSVVATVYRPSIVIGDSTSGKATHFHGVYAFIRGLWMLSSRMRRGHAESNVLDLPLRIQGSADSTLNFVPVDFVTEAIMDLAPQPASQGRTFHLTNPGPTHNRLWLDIVCRQLGIKGLRLVDANDFARTPMTRLETIFHRQMTFYSPYLVAEPAFDCSATLQALSSARLRCPEITPQFAAKMTGWYIDRLKGAIQPEIAREQ